MVDVLICDWGYLESKLELRKYSNGEKAEICILHYDDGHHGSEGSTVIALGEDVHLDKAYRRQLGDGLTGSDERHFQPSAR